MPTIRIMQILVLSFGLAMGGISHADMSMKMSTANNPCANKHHNPCNMKDKNPCNPCSMKSKNPCNMKNPCNKKHDNPCNMKSKNSCNPCSMKNPCDSKHHNPCNMKSKNPCASSSASDAIDPERIKRPAGTKLYSKESTSELSKVGEKLFKDNALSSNGLSCNSCHATDHLFNKSFAKPYPHKVSMTKQRAGLNIVDADEFIQFCLIAPMASKTLPWESKKLAALTAYVKEVKQKNFIQMVRANPCYFKQKTASNPCASKNPCNMKNPCSQR